MKMMPISLNSICVFCGSSPGLSASYEEVARATARALVRANLRLIYGGGRVGLMGVLADAVILAGGHVTGVMPRVLFDREKGEIMEVTSTTRITGPLTFSVNGQELPSKLDVTMETGSTVR